MPMRKRAVSKHQAKPLSLEQQVHTCLPYVVGYTPEQTWVYSGTSLLLRVVVDGFRRAFRNSKSHEPPPKGTPSHQRSTSSCAPGRQAAWMQEVEDLPPARPPFQPGKVQGSLRRRPREQALLGPLAMACRAGALKRSSAWHSALLPFGKGVWSVRG